LYLNFIHVARSLKEFTCFIPVSNVFYNSSGIVDLSGLILIRFGCLFRARISVAVNLLISVSISEVVMFGLILINLSKVFLNSFQSVFLYECMYLSKFCRVTSSMRISTE
jgi:hypothetical protein